MRLSTESFKEVFCAHYSCRESEYEVQALFRLIHREARLLARFLWRVYPSFFTVDREIIRMLGSLETRDAILAAARRIEMEYRIRGRFGWLRQTCLVWVSPEQVVYTVMRLWPGATRVSNANACASSLNAR